MHGLTLLSVSCTCMWLVGSVDLATVQGGAVRITSSGEGTFLNCNFISNSAKNVSLEEEHGDESEKYMFC